MKKLIFLVLGLILVTSSLAFEVDIEEEDLLPLVGMAGATGTCAEKMDKLYSGDCYESDYDETGKYKNEVKHYINNYLSTVNFVGNDVFVDKNLVVEWEQLSRAISECSEVKGSNYEINVYDHFCCRKVAGTKRLSGHAYGKAIDINVEKNPYISGKSCTANDCDIPSCVLRAIKDTGFSWGGAWKSSCDAQHIYWNNGKSNIKEKHINLCNADNSNVLPQDLSKKVVVIDPGHGSDINKRAKEDKIVLQVALKVEDILTKEGINVMLTRNTIGDSIDGVLSDCNSGDCKDCSGNAASCKACRDNHARVKIGNDRKADLFFSIHSNSGEDSGFFLMHSGDDDRNRKNRCGISMKNPNIIPNSKLAAETILREMVNSGMVPKKGAIRNRNIHGKQTFKDTFTEVPLVGIEMYGHENEDLYQKYENNIGKVQERMAEAIAKGIIAYLNGLTGSAVSSGTTSSTAGSGGTPVSTRKTVGSGVVGSSTKIDQSKREEQIDEVWLILGRILRIKEAVDGLVWHRGSWVKKSSAVSSSSTSSGTGSSSAVRGQAINQRVVDIAEREFKIWDDGGWDDLDEKGLEIIKEKYDKPFSDKGKGHNFRYETNSKGKETLKPHWSAIFISYVMDAAGVSTFPICGGHFCYFRSIKNRPRECKTFPMRDIDQIQPGDLLCNCRSEGKNKGCPIDYDNLPKGPKIGHCDIVVKRNGDSLRLIGGNVGHRRNNPNARVTGTGSGSVGSKRKSISAIKSESAPNEKGHYYGWISCSGGSGASTGASTGSNTGSVTRKVGGEPVSSSDLKEVISPESISSNLSFYTYKTGCKSFGYPQHGRVEGIIVPKNVNGESVNVNFYFHGNKNYNRPADDGPNGLVREFVKRHDFLKRMDHLNQVSEDAEVMVIFAGGEQHWADCKKWNSGRTECLEVRDLKYHIKPGFDAHFWMSNGRFSCFYDEAISKIKELDVEPDTVSFMAHSGGGGLPSRVLIAKNFYNKLSFPIKRILYFDACSGPCNSFINKIFEKSIEVRDGIYSYYRKGGNWEGTSKKSVKIASDKNIELNEEFLKATAQGTEISHGKLPEACLLDYVNNEGCTMDYK